MVSLDVSLEAPLRSDNQGVNVYLICVAAHMNV